MLRFCQHKREGYFLNIKENLQNLMNKNKINSNQLAIKLEIDRSNVSRWLSGKQKPSLEQLEQLTKIFNCSYDDLLK